jgi:hypothetical protein
LTIEAPPPPEDDPFGAIYDLADKEQEVARQQESSTPSGMRCPSCSSPLAPGAVLCVQCGFDMRTKSKLKAKKDAPAAAAASKGSRPGLAPLGGSRPQQDDEKPAPEGNYFLGLAYGFGFAVVAAIVCFFAWTKADDFPFIKWMVLLIGAGAGFGVNLGYKAGTHFAGATAAGITVIISVATQLAVWAVLIAPAVNQAIDESSSDRDERVMEMLANEEEKKANIDPDHASIEQMTNARKAASKRLKEMPEKEYKDYVAKADAKDEKEELMEYMVDDVLKERGVKPEDANEVQEQAAHNEASKRIDAMSAAQRKEKLASGQKNAQDQLAQAKAKAKAEAAASRSGSRSHHSSDDDDGTSSAGKGFIVFVILIAIVFFLWAMMPTIVAMGLAWKLAANS